MGHAYSALLAYDLAHAAGGDFLLRIEDIDQSRARPEWEAQIFDDLVWLGLHWPTPVMRQSDRMDVYEAALDALWARGLLYLCTCTRADIAAATSAPQEGAPLLGPDGLIYPGTCRHNHTPTDPRPRGSALRLDMEKACACVARSVEFTEDSTNTRHAYSATDLIEGVGDIVLARRDMGTSYHLSVVLDDAAQSITHVVRGADLFDATRIHILLQHLLGLPTPLYHHHKLIRDEAGKRLAKRDDARAISLFRAEGLSPEDIRSRVSV